MSPRVRVYVSFPHEMRDVAIVSDHVTGESAVAVFSLIHDAHRLVFYFQLHHGTTSDARGI